jgi:hypothetical protein
MMSEGKSLHGYTARDGWFIDPLGRRTLLRGVNLGGSTKMPFRPNGATHLGTDFERWAEVSFVGRPFPLSEADEHLRRLAHWGFNVLRLLVTWEAIEHKGPGEYDEAYLDYVREVVKKAREHGLLVFIDPHQDVWSRWSGGDGAPFWCFEWAGLEPKRFVEAGAVALDAVDWPANYERVPAATMFTLFLGGETFCPELKGIQTKLQDHYVNAVCAVAERVAGLNNVLGYDSLNEPSPGYIGRGDDMAEAHSWGSREKRGFSTLDYSAAADGNTIRNADGETLNSSGASVWRNGCPWKRAGVWEIGGDGKPVLLAPSYFKEVEGRPIAPWHDFMVPFIKRMRAALRKVDPGCFVFIEGSPGVIDSVWDDADPFICNERHWYDLPILAPRVFKPEEYVSIAGESLSGLEAIADWYAKQFTVLRAVSRERMRDVPMLMGEFGIPYDMNGCEAYRTGDYTAQEIALDATYRAMEAVLINSTQWNYTVDNSHEHGDQWNHEDLSIWSKDDQRDASDVDSGARALRSFCRPYVQHAAGQPTRMSFDRASGAFELEVDSDPSVRAPTVIYAPRLHYPGDVNAMVSSGSVIHDAESQTLVWTRHQGVATLRLTPA